MDDLRTDPNVLLAIKQAVEHPPNHAEIKNQTVSFVMSSFGRKGVTRVRVEQVLAEQSGND